MIVAIKRGRGRGRGLGDDIEDALAGKDSDGLLSNPVPVATDGLLTPTWASSSTSAAPVAVSQGNTPSAWSWSGFATSLVQGVTKGLTMPKTPTTLLPASSGVSTGLVLAGVGGLVVVGLLLMRKRDA